ncbi:MAG: ABC transporter substrate-binding protein [Thermodesulfobacteriota bacterium]|nr:ABC transporter substrate-binding protein [Thermodesulfobacteriota bacterium]
MNYEDEDLNRRDFLKRTGTMAIGTALVGLSPGIITTRKAYAKVPIINFAYILSDHHAPLMVLAKDWELFQERYNIYLKPVTEYKLYDFFYNGSKMARVKLIPTKKGPDLEKLVAQGSVDMGISGTQAILMSIDKGVKTKIISPLQTAGNVFVLKKGFPMNNWSDFVNEIKGSKSQFKIGMPGPHTVATIIFRSALDHEGISYTEDFTNKQADILFVNMKGHGNLISALANRITEGIIGAQPFPAVTINRGLGKLILNLQDVPPNNRWYGHACCSLEATDEFLKRDRDLLIKMMELIVFGVNAANQDKEMTARACSSWLGIEEAIEKIAMPTLTYTTTPTSQWVKSVYTYVKIMDGMDIIGKKLRGIRGKELDPMVFDFQYIDAAKEDMRRKKFIS